MGWAALGATQARRCGPGEQLDEKWVKNLQDSSCEGRVLILKAASRQTALRSSIG